MLSTIFTVAYALVATFSIYMTWREHVAKKRSSVLWTAIGMLTCLVWPVVVVVLSVERIRRMA